MRDYTPCGLYSYKEFRDRLIWILSSLVFLLALITNLPQIQKILSARSGLGISTLSLCIKLSGLTVVVAYSHAQGHYLSQYGEYFIFIASNFIVFTSVLFFEYGWPHVILLIGTYSTYAVILFGAYSGFSKLNRLNKFCLVLATINRVPQLWKNYTQKGTGQLSVTKYWLIICRTLCRLLTILLAVEDVKWSVDRFVLVREFLNLTSASAIVAQILYYRYYRPSTRSRKMRRVGERAAGRHQKNKSRDL